MRELRAVGGACPSRYLPRQAVNLSGFTACISFDTHRSDYEMSSASALASRTMHPLKLQRFTMPSDDATFLPHAGIEFAVR